MNQMQWGLDKRFMKERKTIHVYFTSKILYLDINSCYPMYSYTISMLPSVFINVINTKHGFFNLHKIFILQEQEHVYF